MNKHKTSFFNVALLAAALGGLGAAVIAHPKGKEITSNLRDVGDDLVDAVDRAIDKIHKSDSQEQFDISQFVVSIYSELKDLHESGAKEPDGNLGEAIKKVENRVEKPIERIEEDISHGIAWLEKKGRSLAKRGYK